MGRISEQFKYPTTPICNNKAIVKGEKYRFSILTPSLIRMEYSESGVFEDRATKVAINRNFPVPFFSVKYEGDLLKIKTEKLEIYYHTNLPFHESSLTARFAGEWGDSTQTWRFRNTYPTYGDCPRTFPGTVRSLDSKVGPVPLGSSLMSMDYADWDDSKSPVLCDDGWVEDRPDGIEDIYLFAYREHHIDCLRDFFTLSGKIPMLPRYALGNWWSRYYAYSADEYKDVISGFLDRKIPLSVGVLDVDWHITKIDKQYGRGWSGYTFNEELFPDPKSFLSWMHEQGLKVTANLHDREGIAPVEENYIPLAKSLGIDFENKGKIEFDFNSPEYIENYFKYTHYDNENRGIDFWWVDGFPENRGPMLKADIPWMLNHYHYIDSMKHGNRGMLLSRFCGLGGHRYGVEFSGDTNSTWAMLDFLPYFTASASNVGCGWWSHDVGGFMCGTGDEEMYIRWEEFCVFSPINRLHCTDNPYMSREPWKYSRETERILTDFLRLRHKLIPYIYTMNYRCYRDNITLIRPLYYYTFIGHLYKNEYFFGDDFIVSPITSKTDSVTKMGHTKTYLPEGIWFDYFTGRKYIGDRYYNNYREIDAIPVFVKAGSVIPTAVLDSGNGIDNPKHLQIDVFPLDNGKFELYEDDGITLDYQNGNCVVTNIEFKWQEKPIFKIHKPVGNTDLISSDRRFTICFKRIASSKIKVSSCRKQIDFQSYYKDNSLYVCVDHINDEVTVEFLTEVEALENDYVADMDKLIMRSVIENNDKVRLGAILHSSKSPNPALTYITSDSLDTNFKNAAIEIMTSGLK